MCEIGIKFTNIDYYNKEMQKGMEDKLFFIERLPQNQNYMFVDFGCADGSMINALASIYKDNPHNCYVGYDISEEMIKLAKTNYHGPVNANVKFTTDWNICRKNASGAFVKRKKVLIMSSVIHEVYSYANDENDIVDFWNKVTSDFDYIVIRDMCPSKDIDRDARKSLTKAVETSKAVTSEQLGEFSEIWGTLTNNKNAIHFLLKYRWKVNWDRKVHENYFPIYVENLIKKITDKDFYKIDYLERFRVPFLDKCIKEDFGIELDDFTHIKAIFSKKQLAPAEDDLLDKIWEM